MAAIPTYDPDAPLLDAVPAAEPVAVALLVAMLPGVVNVSTPGRNAEPSLPMVRVTSTGQATAPRAEERTPLFQIDVWADTFDEAEGLAVFLGAAWPRLRDITADRAYVSGAWVETDPVLQPEVDETEPPRFRLGVGLRIHPALQE